MLCCFHSDQGCTLGVCRAGLGQQTARNVCAHPHYISVYICVNAWAYVSLSACTPEVACNRDSGADDAWYRLSPSNLQQMRNENVYSLQFIFRSCHLVVESSGCVWGAWKEAPLSCAQQAAYVNLNHNIDLLSFYACGGNLTQGFVGTCWESQEYRSAFSDFNTPLDLLTITAPRHPLHTNLTRTRVHSRMHIHTPEYVTHICVTMPASAHTRLDAFIHKLIRRVDLPAAIHHTVARAWLGTVWQQSCRRELPGI